MNRQWEPTKGLRAVVETYAVSTSSGVETGWTVKVGDDSLEDFQTKEEADDYANNYNVARLGSMK